MNISTFTSIPFPFWSSVPCHGWPWMAVYSMNDTMHERWMKILSWKPTHNCIYMSYRQNLIHGEGTSLGKVGPYRFCSGGTLYKPSWGYRLGVVLGWAPIGLQQWQPHEPLNSTLVMPNFVEYSYNYWNTEDKFRFGFGCRYELLNFSECLQDRKLAPSALLDLQIHDITNSYIIYALYNL